MAEEPPKPHTTDAQKRFGCVLGFVGVLLLLPGVCSLLAMMIVPPTPDLWTLWAATIAGAALGLVMIVSGTRRG